MEILNRLLEISIYAVILFLAIICIKRVFKNKMSPALHFVIWFLLIARLCIPATIDSGLRLVIIPENPFTQTTAQTQEAAADLQDNSVSHTAEPQTNKNVQNIPQTQQANTNTTTSQTTNSQPGGLLQWITSMKWADILIAPWLLGMLLVGAWMICMVVRMNRIILMLGIKPKADIRELLEKCKTELGIKKDIPLYLLPKISTPALTIGFKPKLVLPFDIAETLSGQQLEFAIKHELTHYKRKDNITSLLLRILEVVYWFNPVVWLMGKCMLSDMETACDSMVVRTLDKENKKRYVLTLLEMFSNRKVPQFLLGMALNNTDKVAEKRIRGVYMKNKSKRSVKLVAGILAAVLILACFTTACQPTPEKEIVVGKNGQVEEQIGASPVPIHEYNFPDSYQMSFESYNGALNVRVDANIGIPGTDKYPAYHITRSFFSQEQADNLISILMGDKKIYKNLRTRSDIEKDLIDMRQLYHDVKSGKYGDTKDYSFYTGRISELEKELAAIPENLSDQESDGMLLSSQTGNELNIKAYLGKNEPATLKIENNTDQNMTSCFFINGNEYFEDSGNEKAIGVDITADEVIQFAEDFLQSAGLDDFYVVYVKKGSVYLTGDEKTDKEGYVVTCARKVADIPVTYNINAGSDATFTDAYENPSLDSFNPMLFNERFIMTFDDSGLTTLHWENPINTEMLNGNVEIMDFEKMMPLFEQAMINKFAWIEQPEGVEGKITGISVVIDRIALGFTKAPIKDSPGEYMLVPAWDFFGSYIQKYEGQEDSTSSNDYSSFVTINAIDGSVINGNY